MGIPPRALDDDEQVVVDVRPHGRVVVGPALVLLVVAPVTVVMAFSVPAGQVGVVLRWLVLGLGALVVVRGAVVPFLVWRSTSYTVTTHRVSVRRGVLHRFGRDVPLGRVNGVTFRSGPWDRPFGSGRIRIDTAGEGPLVLDDVPAVERVQRAVQTYAEQAQEDDADDDAYDTVDDAFDDAYDDAFEEDVEGDDWDDVDVRVPDDEGDDEGWDDDTVAADPEPDDVTWRRRGRSGWGRRR